MRLRIRATRLTVDLVFDDLRTVLPLNRAEPHPVAEPAGSHGAEDFCRRDVNPRLGEVGDTADVVGVEMGDDDVPDVRALVSEPLDLFEGGLREVERRPKEDRRIWPKRPGCAQSSDPNQVSTSTSPSSDTTNSTWHTSAPAPSGRIDPQFR